MIIENFPTDFLLGKYELKGVKAYGDKFMLTKQERMMSLINRVSQELNVNKKELNYSENSLNHITKWLKSHITKRKLSKAEYKTKIKDIPDYIEVNDWDFDQNTISNIIDVGTYLGEVMIQNHKNKNLKWTQFLGSRKNVDFGHMIIKLDKLEMNPVDLVYVFCLKAVDGRDEEDGLLGYYKIWEECIEESV